MKRFITDEAVEAAAKDRWEAACAHHRAEGREHPSWEEVGEGQWAPYPKELLLRWERAAIEAFLAAEGFKVEHTYQEPTHIRLVSPWGPEP